MVAVLGVVAFAQIPASAELKLPELPLPTASPLDLEDLLNLDELLNGPLPASTDVGQIVDDTTGTVSNLLGDTTDQPPVLGGTDEPPVSRPAPQTPATGSWSTDRVLLPPGAAVPATRVASHKIGPSYTGALGNGFSRAARRAAELAGPVAAPMILALFAVGLLFVAARGPGRLVKVEEERKAFSERRTFRL
ncbi:MAG: hypothetical protein ACRDKS_07425 [Actinomycetota bacterium]